MSLCLKLRNEAEELLKVEERSYLLWSRFRVLFVGILLRVKINLYEHKSKPVGRDEKMLVSQRAFKAVDQRTVFHPFLKGVSDISPPVKCLQIFTESRFSS